MFNNFIKQVIDTTSYKQILTEKKMLEFAQADKVYFVKSDLLYRMYTLFSNEDKKLTRPEFYRKCGYYLYYERLTCVHGEEYYYYVRFNEDSPFYKEHKELIKRLIIVNDPSRLEDYIGLKDIDSYNLKLKAEVAV